MEAEDDFAAELAPADTASGEPSERLCVPEFFAVLGVQVLLGKAAEEEPGAEEEGDDKGDEDIKSPEAHSPSFLHEHTAHSTHHIDQYLRNPAS